MHIQTILIAAALHNFDTKKLLSLFRAFLPHFLMFSFITTDDDEIKANETADRVSRSVRHEQSQVDQGI